MKKSFFDKQNRYSIRKLTVGAASVLIGFAFMSNSQSAKAATENGNNTNTVSAKAETTNKDANATSKQPNADLKLSKASVAPQTATSPADGVKGQTQFAANDTQSPVATQAKTTPTTTDVQKPVAPKGSEARPYANNFMVQAPQAKAVTTSVDPATLRGTQTAQVANWQDLVNALNNASVGTINITSNITVADKGTTVSGLTRPNAVVNGGKMTLNGTNISGGLIINGNGNTIDFGANYLAFTTNNQKTSTPWDIEFKDLTINATGYDEKWLTRGGSFSPIYMGSDDIDTTLLAKNKVTFNGVTADVKNGAFYSTNMTSSTSDKPYTTVVFAGKNNITVEKVNVNGNQLYNYASAIDASRVIFANGTDTTINVSSAKTNNDLNAGANIIRAKVEDSTDTQPPVIVEQGANVTLNGKSNDVRGIMANDALVGTVQVDGNLTENMAAGHSTAILAGNLNIGKTGNLTINTQQDNNKNSNTTNANENFDGFHYAPISLGTGISSSGSTNADSTTLDDQGTLVINRTGDPSTITPLIAFGSLSSALIKGQFTLNVDNDATLDLQDDAVYSTTDNNFFPGLISMYGAGQSGSGTFNHVNITNPAYVNFQRTGSQSGQLMRLENMNNQVNIIGNGANVPLAEWSEGNTTPAASFLWYITQLQNQNNWGAYSITGFTPKNNSIGQAGAGVTFLNSNGSVTLGSNQAGKNGYNFTDGVVAQGDPAQGAGVDYETPYLNQLLNQFSWAKSQRISIGSKAPDNPTNTDANKYSPTVAPIDGNTSQKLSDLPLTNTDHTQGLTGLYDPDQKKEVDLSKVDLTKSHWYDSTTDVATWNKQMLGADDKTPMPVPTNPTGNLKTTDKSAWATVVYKDGSIDFVNIPLNITAPTDASTYTPEQKPNSVDKGATSVPAANGVTDYKNDKDGTTTTTFPNDKGVQTPPTVTWDNPKPGQDPETGVPDGVDVNTPGVYDNIPATVTYPDGSKDKINETVVVGNVVDVTDNNNHNHDNTPDDPNAIPDGYELVNVTITNGHFGSDTSATTPKKYLVKDNTSKDEFVSAVDPTANDGYSQNSENWTPELPATFGKSDMNKSYNVAFSKATLDKDLFQPSYTGQTMKPSDSKDVPVAYTPSTDGKINVGGKAPEGTKYTVDNTGLPAGMTATVADDGTVTITTVNTPEGAVNIPVTVTYPDGTADKPDSETVYVPVIVTDKNGDQTVTWGDNGAVVTTVNTDNLKAHETSDNSQVLNAASAVTVNGYKLGSDGKISTTATPITVDPSKVTWSTTPDTTVDNASVDGKKITNESIKVDLTVNTDAQNILGSKNGVVTTDPFTIDAKGAGAKNVTTPVDVTEGSDLTDDQFKALVDNNIPTDEIASTTWGTKPDKDGNGGVIKITFNDKDKDGNPTYLNINIPASSLNMVPKNTTNQADKYTPETKPNEVKNGATSIPAENGIKDYKDKDGKVVTTMPDKNGNQKAPTVTWDHSDDKGMPIDPATGNPIDTSKPGIYDNVPAKVTYPDGSVDDNVPETVVVGNVIDVTNNPKHNDPTKDPAPDGYIYETFKAVNGSFAPLANTPVARAANPTTKIFLVKANTTVNVLSQLNPQPNEGFVAPGNWDKTVPTTFTAAGTYTITFSKGTTGSTDTDAAQYDVTYKPQIVKGGDSVTINPIVTKGTDKTPTTVPDGTKYSFDNGTQTTTIDGVTVNIDQTTGKITFTAPTDSSATMNIPVKVTYPDNTADKPSVDDTTATVYVVNGYPKDKPAQNPQNAGDAIKGKDKLPDNTTETYDPNKTPDPHKDGNQDTNITVNIPGVGSVTVPSTVTYPDQKTVTYPQNNPVEQGKTTVIKPTIPEGEKPTFKPGDTSNLPGGMGVTVDPNTGDITVTTKDDTPTGDTTIPVVVDPGNGDKPYTVNVPVTVTKSGDTGTKPTTPAQGAIVITYYDKNKGVSETVSQAPDITGSNGQSVSAADLKYAIDNSIPTGWVIDPSFVYPDAMTIPGNVNVPVVWAGDQGQVPPTNGGNQGGDKNPSTGDNQIPTDNGNNNNNQNTNNNGDNGMNNSNGNGSNANSGANTGMSNSGMMNTSNTMNNGAKTSSKNSANMNMNANSKKLPQTGEAKNNAGIFGLAIASIAGLFGLAGSRKRREDK